MKTYERVALIFLSLPVVLAALFFVIGCVVGLVQTHIDLIADKDPTIYIFMGIESCIAIAGLILGGGAIANKYKKKI